ncbi:MAG TPA: YMGG-like glycine zipper-containing protein [Aridibacter sp.]|nr:YMGG-like glycine zipper-containing protein [Aridibacter sp.]
MKRTLIVFAAAALFFVSMPLAANAQTSGKRYYREDRQTTRRYRQERKDKNFYEKHRNVLNVAIGSGAGAVIGALLGGKKGALIGAGVGAGAGAVYTYGIDPKDEKKKKKNRRYRRQ